MTWLRRAAFFLLLAIVGFVAGGLSGALSLPPRTGLEGGATVLLWGLGGMVACLVGGAQLRKRLSPRGQGILFVVIVALAVLAVVWVSVRIRVTTVSLALRATPLDAAQHILMVKREDLPIGRRIAQVVQTVDAYRLPKPSGHIDRRLARVRPPSPASRRRPSFSSSRTAFSR